MFGVQGSLTRLPSKALGPSWGVVSRDEETVEETGRIGMSGTVSGNVGLCFLACSWCRLD